MPYFCLPVGLYDHGKVFQSIVAILQMKTETLVREKKIKAVTYFFVRLIKGISLRVTLVSGNTSGHPLYCTKM